MKEHTTSSIIAQMFTLLIFICFLLMKLFDAVSWSWLWITAPLWATYGTGLLVIILSLILNRKNYGRKTKNF